MEEHTEIDEDLWEEEDDSEDDGMDVTDTPKEDDVLLSSEADEDEQPEARCLSQDDYDELVTKAEFIAEVISDRDMPTILDGENNNEEYDDDGDSFVNNDLEEAKKDEWTVPSKTLDDLSS